MNDGNLTGSGGASVSHNTRQPLALGLGVCIVLVGFGLYKLRAPVLLPGMKMMSSRELSGFDGTDPDKPIYLALDGFVYDVSAGKSYYVAGGTYHFLAGKDSSEDLHIAGAGIIKRKYPVIATFIK
jgi:predicted heme/steroid binding protein